jgi:hypothetical protein
VIVGGDRTYIRKVRAASAGGDASALQLRLASSLSGLDLRPGCLPRSAIACVRRLPDPMPGVLRRTRTGEPPPRAWESAARDALDRLVSAAAHPARGEVRPDAQAVVFADEAELLACLAQDWLAGAVSARWWWRSLFRDQAVPRPVPAAWLQAPHHAPAALKRLAAKGQAVAFARALTTQETRRLLQAITRAFALADLHVLPTPAESMPGPVPTAPVPPRVERHPQRRPVARRHTATPPWQPHVPESLEPDLSADHQALLGVALMLHRAPAVVRSPAFAHAVADWQRAAVLHASTVVPPRSAPDSEPPTRPAATEATLSRAAAEAMAPAAHVRAAPDSARPTRRGRRFALRRVITAARAWAARLVPRRTWRLLPPTPRLPERIRLGALAPVTPVDKTEFSIAGGPGGEISTLSERARGPGPALAADPALPRAQTATVEALPEFPDTSICLEIDTRLGGVFYLLNVALSLGLYSDFTAPEGPNIGLSPWDLLTLVGRELVRAEFDQDPVWGLLAWLAGRAPHEPPGGPDDTWTGWVESLMPVLRTRLDLALRPGPKRGLSAELPGGTDNAGERVCVHAARVIATDTRVDVIFALDALPIQIRLAGLDRDPGWLPAAGRSVLFHFEGPTGS